MSRCIIFGALPVGELSDEPLDGDLVIAADKGYDVALSLGIRPDIVVGDFDSRGEAPEGENLVRLPVRKDDTDVGYAVKLALERGYRDFAVYGAAGGKLDHTVANIQLASLIAQSGGTAVFYGESESFAVIPGGFSLCFDALPGGRASVFSLSERSEGVTIEGLSYTLHDAVLTRDFPLGVSNAFVGEPARIAVGQGELLVIWQGQMPPIFSKL